MRGFALAYILGGAMLFALQRKIIFHAPPPRDVDPAAGALVRGVSPQGRPVVALWSPGPEGAPVVVYFHGNGMQLADCVDVVTVLRRQRWGAMAVEYPGYGPLAHVAPSETALMDVARGAMAMLRGPLGVPPSRTVLLGQSLGTGVASALATPDVASRVVLMTPFRSLPEVAAERFPWFPVRWIMLDRFDTMSRAASITLPVLVIHGTHDEIVPYAHGVAVSQRVPHARLVTVRGAMHNTLWEEHLTDTLGALVPFVDQR